jgi:WD40 repeat protein
VDSISTPIRLSGLRQLDAALVFFERMLVRFKASSSRRTPQLFWTIPMKISFRPLWLVFLIATLLVMDSQSFAEEPPAKVVRLIWFPRFSPDGKRVVSAHGSWEQKEGGEVRVFDSATGEMEVVLPCDRGVRTVGWSPSGKWFASGDYGGVCRLYDSESRKVVSETKFPNTNVEVLQFLPDETQLITALGDGSVVIADLPSLKKVYSFNTGHRGGIWGMRLANDGKTFATAGKDGYVRIFDIKKRELKHELIHPTQTNGVEFTSDTKELATGCLDSKIRFFDVMSGRLLRTLTAHKSGSVTDMAFSPDDKLLATSGGDGAIRLWDTSKLSDIKLKSTVAQYKDLAFGVDISPDGKWLVCVGWDEQVQLWDVATQKQKWKWQRMNTN